MPARFSRAPLRWKRKGVTKTRKPHTLMPCASTARISALCLA